MTQPFLSHACHSIPWKCCVTGCALILGLLGWASSTWSQEPVPPLPLPAESSPLATVGATAQLLMDRPIGQLQPTLQLPAGAHSPENAARPHLQAAGQEFQPPGLGRGFCLEPVDWDATALRHRPLYFEEPNLERLGYYYGYPCDGRYRRFVCSPISNYLAEKPDDSWVKCQWFEWQYELDCNPPHNQVIQPLVSACNFYGRIAFLPYQAGVYSPREDIYAFGEDRPGSPVPYRKHYLPLDLRGLLYQGAAVTGLAYMLP